MKSITRLFGLSRRRIAGVVAASAADAVEAAVIDMERRSGNRGRDVLTWELLDFARVPYPDAVRAEIEAVTADGERVLERLTRLHFILAAADYLGGVAPRQETRIRGDVIHQRVHLVGPVRDQGAATDDHHNRSIARRKTMTTATGVT